MSLGFRFIGHCGVRIVDVRVWVEDEVVFVVDGSCGVGRVEICKRADGADGCGRQKSAISLSR